PLRSTLFPYTTLFRSGIEAFELGVSFQGRKAVYGCSEEPILKGLQVGRPVFNQWAGECQSRRCCAQAGDGAAALTPSWKNILNRSEEHTSELQSPCNL